MQVITVGAAVTISQGVPSSNSILKLAAVVTDGNPEPLIVRMSPPAGFRAVSGVTVETTRATLYLVKPDATGMLPWGFLTSGSKLPAMHGESRVHVRVEPSFETIVHPEDPTVTWSMSVGRDVPMISTDKVFTFIEVISAVTAS